MQHHQQQQLDKISVLDIIVGKSRALTSLQNRGTNLTLSGVTNISTIAMDVPLRPQEVHDLVNRVGRLITSYAQEFLPDDIYIYIANADIIINSKYNK
ncbi:unnamed protein product [Rotaria magnacalcarata]|uniref:Uncharacterized protein n=1 Tax=Rotaria magnacalcarata TaxID=392030 RepID=A0A820QVR5_9BILA|nr:unnamed protein product [Rotaria magnacalcarata]